MDIHDDDAARPFVDTLRLLLGGRVHGRLTDEQAKVIRSVRALRRKGELHLKLTYSLEGDRGDQMRVSAKVTAKPPVPDEGSGLFFVTEDGALVVDDPKQHDIFRGKPATVDRETGEIKTSAGGAEE